MESLKYSLIKLNSNQFLEPTGTKQWG